jgi:DNA-directed RNA polymerase subunit beta'
VVAEIDGEVAYGKDTKGKRKVTITPEIGQPKDYMIPRANSVRARGRRGARG